MNNTQPFLFTETNKNLVKTVKMKSLNHKIEDSTICVMASGFGRYGDLFAAAPELLEALEIAKIELESLRCRFDDDKQSAIVTSICQTWDRANRAIAKAKGEL